MVPYTFTWTASQNDTVTHTIYGFSIARSTRFQINTFQVHVSVTDMWGERASNDVSAQVGWSYGRN